MRRSGYSLGNIELLLKSLDNKRNSKEFTLLYVRKGVGLYALGENLICLNEGDVIFLPPGLEYGFSSADLGDEYNINIDAIVLRFSYTWLEELLSVFHVLNDVVLRLKEVNSPLSVQGLKWMNLSSLMDKLVMAGPSRQSCLIIEILELLSTSDDMHPISRMVVRDLDNARKIEKISKYIECNIYGRISLGDISSYSGMSRTYFSLFFKKHFGIGLTDYVNRKRVEMASAMLLSSDKAIGDIAQECGFSNANYFNRVFRNINGMSPREYILKHRS